MNKAFVPAGKSGVVKICIFLIFTAAAGQLRVFYLEGKFPFSTEQAAGAEQKIYKIKTVLPECPGKDKADTVSVDTEHRKGFLSRLGIGKAPPVTYIIPPAEKEAEIEILRINK